MDQILFPCTDFQDRVAARGRGSGNVITERWVVAKDNRQFILGTDNKKLFVGKKFASKMFHFINTVKSETGMDKRDCFNNICNILSKEENKTYNYDSNISLDENIKQADKFFNPFGLYEGKEYKG